MAVQARQKPRPNSSSADKAVIVDALRSIARGLRSSGRQVQESSGLTSAQLDVLKELETVQALSINELAARTYTHQSSVSIVVGRLVEDNLVKRAVDADDARRATVSLTAAGRAALRRAPDSSEERMIAALEGMNRKELRDLAGCLKKLSSILDRANS